jgi:hypothetical protein
LSKNLTHLFYGISAWGKKYASGLTQSSFEKGTSGVSVASKNFVWKKV